MAVDALFPTARSDWRWELLEDVCRRGGGDIQTGPFGSQLHASDYVAVGVPSIMPQNITEDRVNPEGIARITPSDAERLRRYLVKTGDIVYSRRGDVERRALITQREDGWLCGTGCLRVRFGEGVIDPVYASYFLSHPASREWVVRHAVGATMANLNTSILGALPFLLPPLDDQHAIASVLGALDEKVESNRRTALALERLARSIFRAWFQDFEPVNAKAVGATSFRFMPQPVFDALPARFVNSDVGPLPEGWEAKALSDLCALVSGGTPKRSETSYWGGRIPWYSVKDAPRDGEVWVIDTAEHITDEGLSNSPARLVPKGCTIISARGTVGTLALAGTSMAFNQSCYGLLPNDEASFCYLHLLIQTAVDELQQRTHGSVFDTITRATFDGLMVVSPPEGIVSSFEIVAAPLFEALLSIRRESVKLSQLRDSILPRLLSGSVLVAAAND